MEAFMPQTEEHNLVQMALLNLYKFVEDERPNFLTRKAYEEEEERRLTEPGPEDSTEFDPEKYHDTQKGSIRAAMRPYGIGSIYSWETPNLFDCILFISLGIFGFFGQLFMTKAFQSAEAHMVAPFKYVEVVFTLIIGYTIIDEKYSVLHLLGALLVIFGLLLNIFYREKNLKKTKKLF